MGAGGRPLRGVRGVGAGGRPLGGGERCGGWREAPWRG